MRRLRWLLLVLGLLGTVVSPRWSSAAPPLVELQVVPLAGVERRIDHFAVDPAGRRLFVAALGNGTLEVVDLAAGKRIRSIPGLKEPQGVAYLPTFHRIVVATRGGTVAAFDDSDYRPAITMPDMSDADNLRFDAAAGQLYLGYGDGALGVIEPASMKRIADIPLPGHPESFRLEEAGPRIFVNVPRTREILVVDRGQRSIVSHIPLGTFANNYPMSLDESGHRLFVGVRQPARLLVFDTVSGKKVARSPAPETPMTSSTMPGEIVYTSSAAKGTSTSSTPAFQATTCGWRGSLPVSERAPVFGPASWTSSSWRGRCETVTRRRSTCSVWLLGNSVDLALRDRTDSSCAAKQSATSARREALHSAVVCLHVIHYDNRVTLRLRTKMIRNQVPRSFTATRVGVGAGEARVDVRAQSC